MINKIPFADPSPDPKAQADEPKLPERLVTRAQATFQWPPDCLWPFVDRAEMPTFPQADCRTGDRQSEKVGDVKTENPTAVHRPWTVADSRRHPRFKLEIDVTINSRTCGMLTGRSVDISESGIAAMLTIEAPVGEIVELGCMLSDSPMMVRAMVRHRNAFRYGFEFVDFDSEHELLRRTCRDLAMDQSLVWPAIP